MFNFWPFNIALKREEAKLDRLLSERDRYFDQVADGLAEYKRQQTAKHNKVIPIGDVRHPASRVFSADTKAAIARIGSRKCQHEYEPTGLSYDTTYYACTHCGDVKRQNRGVPLGARSAAENTSDSYLLALLMTAPPEAFGSAEPQPAPEPERGGTFDGGGSSGDWDSNSTSPSSDTGGSSPTPTSND